MQLFVLLSHLSAGCYEHFMLRSAPLIGVVSISTLPQITIRLRQR